MSAEVKLPICGKVATFRRLKGGDLIEAERQCQDPKSEKEYGLALLARRVLLNGVQAGKHEMEDMDEDDLAELFRGAEVFLSSFRPAPSLLSGGLSASA
jgi:hypothetical protein